MSIKYKTINEVLNETDIDKIIRRTLDSDSLRYLIYDIVVGSYDDEETLGHALVRITHSAMNQVDNIDKD